MPDFYTYDYERTIEGSEEFKIDNPERVVTTQHELHDQIELVQDENAKALFHELLPSSTKQKTLLEELHDSETFGEILYDISMSGIVCSVRFTRELTEAEIAELDTLVDNHKNNV